MKEREREDYKGIFWKSLFGIFSQIVACKYIFLKSTFYRILMDLSFA